MSILIDIVISVLTTLIVIWAHILGLPLWDRCRAKKAFSRLEQSPWQPVATEPIPSMQPVYAPFDDPSVFAELVRHEVGLRVKRDWEIQGTTATGEHQIAEEIQSLKRLSVRLKPLMD